MRCDARWNGSDGGGDDKQQGSGEDGKVGGRMVAFDVLLVGFGVGGGEGVNPESRLNREEKYRDDEQSDDIAFSLMHGGPHSQCARGDGQGNGVKAVG